MCLSGHDQPNQDPSKDKGGGGCGFSELAAVWHHPPRWVSAANGDHATVFRVILNWSSRETSRPGACKRRPHVPLAAQEYDWPFSLFFFLQSDRRGGLPIVFYFFHLLKLKKKKTQQKPQMDVWNRSRWFWKRSVCHIRWIQSLKKNRRRGLVAGR